MPFVSSRQTSSAHVRDSLGYLEVQQQERLASRWLAAIRLLTG